MSFSATVWSTDVFFMLQWRSMALLCAKKLYPALDRQTIHVWRIGSLFSFGHFMGFVNNLKKIKKFHQLVTGTLIHFFHNTCVKQLWKCTPVGNKTLRER